MEEQLTELEIKKKQKEIQKLDEEITTLRRSNSRQGKIEQLLPLISTLILVAGFVVGIITTVVTYVVDVQRQGAEFETKKVQLEKENRNKIYEKQAEIYIDLSQTAAEISALTDEPKRKERYVHFLSLYNGSLRIVDSDGRILDAAKKFDDLYTSAPSKQKELQESARYLGCASKTWIKNLWDIPRNTDPSTIKCL
jgi:hypothetical protein